ncbi:DNA cytosine methyltransferase [Paracidovorax valerianellae]|uniref:DNA cytosine methyltransferase n=1 Tax=Paracidovorax valerianellae TaxID=187868 RepID=UPI001FE1B041|nr:DNA cytosine methyltransferase [Paracidovorax valerianellae]
MALRSIELCAGVGMLGEGARAGFELLGIEHRTVCYVEREAPAAAQLARLMEAGALDQAPVWSDLLTFNGSAWRGRVDGLVAGFPCQDISIAGRRAGLDGKRSGLFFNILDIADDCDAWLLFLENVSAIATATATAVDEAEGTLEERAAARVVGELADRGWDAEWITLSASDVGASHGRARWFCFAWRVADTGCIGAERRRDSSDVARQSGEAPGQTRKLQRGGKAQLLDDAQRVEQPGQRIHARSRHAGLGASDVDGASAELAHAHAIGQRAVRGRDVHSDGKARTQPEQHGGRVADASQSGLPHAEQPSQPDKPQTFGRRAASELRGTPLFAPGPIDPRWAGVIDHRPELAPAVEPGVCLLANGMAYLVDESRAHQLRQVGNGVVPLQAAVALVELVRRAAG